MAGAGVIGVGCTSGDGTHIQANITFSGPFDPFAPLTGMTVTNSGSRTLNVTITKDGVDRVVPVAAGTRSYTAAQLSAWGYDTLSDVQGMSPAC